MRGAHFGGPGGPPSFDSKTVDAKGTYLRLLRYARPYWPWVALILCLSLFTAFVGILPQQIIGIAVDELAGLAGERQAPPGGETSVERPAPAPSQIPLARYVQQVTENVARWLNADASGEVTFYLLGASFLALFLISNGVSVVQGISMAYLGQSLIYDMRNQVYAHLQKLSLRYFENRQTGDIMSRVINDVNSLEQVIVGPVIDFLTDMSRLVFLLYWCFIWDWQLTVFALLVTPFLMSTTYFFGKLLRKNFTLLRQKIGELNGLLQDNISGIRVIMAFSREPHEMGRFREKNRENYGVHFRLAKIFSALRPIIGLLENVGTVLVLCVGGIKVLHGDMQLGVFTVFLAYLRMIYGPITGLTRFYNHIQQALASSERVFELLDTQPEVKDKPNALRLGRLRGEVEFRGVSFAC